MNGKFYPLSYGGYGNRGNVMIVSNSQAELFYFQDVTSKSIHLSLVGFNHYSKPLYKYIHMFCLATCN